MCVFVCVCVCVPITDKAPFGRLFGRVPIRINASGYDHCQCRLFGRSVFLSFALVYLDGRLVDWSGCTVEHEQQQHQQQQPDSYFWMIAKIFCMLARITLADY